MRREACLLLGTLLLGCADDSSDDMESEMATDADPAAFSQQLTQGTGLYGQKCASCHGAQGEGTLEAPRVVGLSQGALPRAPRRNSQRAIELVTVGDLGTFVLNNMPPNRAGSLSNDEYWAVVAYLASANGIQVDRKLTPDHAKTLPIPR